MSSYDDTLLAARFAALAPEPRAGDWEDVLERAARGRKAPGRFVHSLQRRPHRRLVVIGAVALVVVIAAASALAVRAIVFDHGIIGLAPEGATPSTPASGVPVLKFMFGHTPGDPGRFTVDAYADGPSRTDDFRNSTGYLEQRLTPEGVELLRAEVVSTGLVDHDLNLYGDVGLPREGLYFGYIDFRNQDRGVHVTWGDDILHGVPPTPEQRSALIRLDERLENPTSWLPASAWEDPEIRAYVPSSYSVCLAGKQGLGLDRVLALLPSKAADMFRTQKNTPNEYTNAAGTFRVWCSELTNDEARALERTLDDAGVPVSKDRDRTYLGERFGSFDPAEFSASEFSLDFTPNLPDAGG
jgi:hypothetical protein